MTATASAAESPAIKLPSNPAGSENYQTAFSRFVHRVCWLHGRIIWFLSFRTGVINTEALDTPGGYQIACTHLSHLEPFLIAIYSRRPLDWLTRIEFYKFGWATWFLKRFGAIPVRRQGCSASAVRTAIDRINQGRVVAIAPEGGVATGKQSVCRGGAIKLGACLIAIRTGKPIIPCVILGSHKLNAVGPYLPFRRGRVYLAFGKPLYPPSEISSPKQAREQMGAQLLAEFVKLYQQLLEDFQILDSDIP
jgi:1-acyl-sn-glycerol-3-phosphate acyltransferase